jgi:hypothetical protein
LIVLVCLKVGGIDCRTVLRRATRFVYDVPSSFLVIAAAQKVRRARLPNPRKQLRVY